MLSLLLAAALLLTSQESHETGVLTGLVVPPQPAQVILLPSDYVDLWSSEVQRRLDLYWQQYQVALRTRKEMFSELSRQAHKDATNFVISRMRRDPSSRISEYVVETTGDGKFEFKNLPFGEYKILAMSKNGNQDLIWEESLDVRSPIPHFLELKKRIP
jgi:hypothetical protein